MRAVIDCPTYATAWITDPANFMGISETKLQGCQTNNQSLFQALFVVENHLNNGQQLPFLESCDAAFEGLFSYFHQLFLPSQG